MNKSTWIVRQWLKYLGVSGLAGVMFLIASLAVLIVWILPGDAQLKRVAIELNDLQNRHKMELANPGKRMLPVESGLTSFYKTFPSGQSAVNQLEKIYKSAESESLVLSQGEYKLTKAKEGHLESYQITLPVKGSYIQIRKFIAKVMNSVPTAALESISFRRESIAGATLEAKIQFSIFLGTV